MGGTIPGCQRSRVCGVADIPLSPSAIFAEAVGVAKRENVIDVSFLEFHLREHLNKVALRAMAVLDPVRLTITNYPEGEVEYLPVENNPEDPDAGSRDIPFSKHLLVERGDFMEDPPKKFFRLGPGRNVRLKGAFILHCEDYRKNAETGEIEEIFCTYYPESRSGQDTSGIKAKGTLHWVFRRARKDRRSAIV